MDLLDKLKQSEREGEGEGEGKGEREGEWERESERIRACRSDRQTPIFSLTRSVAEKEYYLPCARIAQCQ